MDYMDTGGAPSSWGWGEHPGTVIVPTIGELKSIEISYDLNSTNEKDVQQGEDILNEII